MPTTASAAYRVLYEVDDNARIVRIMRVRQRREAYRSMGGGIESKDRHEMIEVLRGECCAVWHRVAPIGPRGPTSDGDAKSFRH